MLANISKDYEFDMSGPPFAPELKSKPSRALICVLSTLLGGMLGVVIVLIRHIMEGRMPSRIISVPPMFLGQLKSC